MQWTAAFGHDLDATRHLNDETKCFICLDTYVKSDLIVIMPCKHALHVKCLRVSMYACPMCRAPWPWPSTILNHPHVLNARYRHRRITRK